MSSEEKLIIDTLIGMSKSMSRIASALDEIKNAVTFDHRQQLRESRQKKPINRQFLTEKKMVVEGKNPNWRPKRNRLDEKSAKQNVQDILDGEYLPQ